MAILKKKTSSRNSVGIKELKNRASAVIDRVTRTRKSILVKKNNRAVARIVPIEEDLSLKLERIDLLGTEPIGKWSDMHLDPIELSSTGAIQAIIEDREES